MQPRNDEAWHTSGDPIVLPDARELLSLTCVSSRSRRSSAFWPSCPFVSLVVKKPLLGNGYQLTSAYRVVAPRLRDLGGQMLLTVPRYNPAIPNVYGVQLAWANPACRIRSIISSGEGNRSTEAGR
jgi:hypothetical protein